MENSLFALDALPRSTFIETGPPKIIRLANEDVTHPDSGLLFLVMISGVSPHMRAGWLSAAELPELVGRKWGWSKAMLGAGLSFLLQVPRVPALDSHGWI